MSFQTTFMSFERLLNIHSDLLGMMNHAVIVTNVDGCVEWVSESYCEKIGLTIMAAKSKTIHEMVVAECSDFYEQIWNTVSVQGKWDGKILLHGQEGALLREKVVITPIYCEGGNVEYLAWLLFESMKSKEEEKRIKFEIEMAKNIQRSVLSPAIADNNIEINAAYFPSEMLAGDMYAWFRIDENMYGIVLIDVMGHSMASALISMSVRSLLRGMVIRLKDPVKIIEEINKHMYNLFSETDDVPNNHLTAMCLIINTEYKTIEYVNAGHPPGYLYRHQSLEILEEGTFILGAFPNMPISKGVLSYDEHAKIILYTDGLLDVIHPNPITSKHHLTQYFIENASLSNDTFIQKLIDDYQLDQAKLADDVCCIAISI